MAITKRPKSSRSEAFTAEAPEAKPMPKLRGRRQPIALALPPDLLGTIVRHRHDGWRHDLRPRTGGITLIGLRAFVLERLSAGMETRSLAAAALLAHTLMRPASPSPIVRAEVTALRYWPPGHG
jgi:hypothetical protein